jgi:phosphoglycerol transferase MdoB-like AlkP superfamily enzyme
MSFCSVDRAFSLAYHFSKTKTLALNDLLGCFWNGWRMDASLSAYISIVPFFLLLINILLAKKWVNNIITYFSFPIIFICVVLCLIDRGIFQHWGYRLDATPLQFIDTPHEMLASLTTFELIATFGGTLLLTYFWTTTIKKAIETFSIIPLNGWQKLSNVVLQLVLICLLPLLIRGGLQRMPMNSSSVYFSDNQYANQTAINPVWNFFYAVFHLDAYKKENPYQYFSLEEAKELVQPMLPSTVDSADTNILNIQKPNVIIIIWESLSAKVFAPLGGDKNVTPALEKIANEGLLFTNLYANGNRSDKGLPAIGSAYPAQPAQSIMLHNSKMLQLPHLSHVFNENGYQSAFYYGGDLNFGNMYAYYNNGGYAPIIGKSSFADKDMNKKWGASDGAVVRRFLDDLPDESNHFFKTIFTLSSHEPFDVPMKARFEGTDDDTKFRNAHAYTDSCIGAFIKEAKTKKWWDNTLIIISADHGHILPLSHNSGFDMPKSFHIPVVFTGGALKMKGICSTFGNQSDIAATLLHQMGWSSQKFPYSKDLFSTRNPHFAHYVFKEGFGYLDKHGSVVFKHDANTFLLNERLSPKTIERAKAYLQMTYQDFIEK